jgi:hypothetical protein
MNDIADYIKNDPVLNTLINTYAIDPWNDWEINLRFAAITIAISQWIDKKYTTWK